MRRVPSVNPNTTIHRETDRAAFGRLLFLLSIGLICAGGFLLAARQHVMAVRLGYQTEELRHEREKLKSDGSQLRFDLERATSPSRITAEGEKLGLQSTTVKQLGPTAAVKPVDSKTQQGEVQPKASAVALKKPAVIAKKPAAAKPKEAR